MRVYVGIGGGGYVEGAGVEEGDVHTRTAGRGINKNKQNPDSLTFRGSLMGILLAAKPKETEGLKRALDKK